MYLVSYHIKVLFKGKVIYYFLSYLISTFCGLHMKCSCIVRATFSLPQHGGSLRDIWIMKTLIIGIMLLKGILLYP